MADDLLINDATLERVRDLLNPKDARAKMIARSESASAERQKVAAGLTESALASAGYAMPKPPKKTVEDLTASFSKLTPGQRKTISDALFSAEVAAGDGDDSSSESLTAGFYAEGAYLAEDDTYSEAGYFANAETDDDDGEY